MEVASSLPFDGIRALQGRPSSICDIASTGRPSRGRSIALYVHYCESGRISEMVHRQVESYAAAGFDVIFITMSKHVWAPDWEAIKAISWLVVRRKNIGRDFGAWRDVIERVMVQRPEIDELLLANDSVIGPVWPMARIMEALRRGGNGMFGLTESIQGGSHLQSYFLLVRGKPAVADIVRFLREMAISHSKWLTVQRGELRMTRYMLDRGHRVRALFGYNRLAATVAGDQVERERLALLDDRFGRIFELPNENFAAALIQQPLNPTHHFWAALVRLLGFPFFKAELLLRNPGRLPAIETWSDLVPHESPCPVALLKRDLTIRTMGPDRQRDHLKSAGCGGL